MCCSPVASCSTHRASRRRSLPASALSAAELSSCARLVRGLTTAAIVWLTAAVGMACGAGLPLLAIAVTALHFVVVFAFPVILRAAFLGRHPIATHLRLVYKDGHGTLRRSLELCTRFGLAVSSLNIGQSDPHEDLTNVLIALEGGADWKALTERLRSIEGCVSVHAAQPDDALQDDASSMTRAE